LSGLLDFLADIDRRCGAVGAVVGCVAAFVVDFDPDVADKGDRGGRLRCNRKDYAGVASPRY
jgi:hypothetical protein